MTKIKSSTILVILTIILLAIYFFVNTIYQRTKSTEIIINGKKIQVEIADTNAKREKGLSFHKPLTDDEGMLFVFENPGRYGFWMKDMTFDLDFIWINNGRVVDITENVSHNNQERIYQPKLPVTEVLEVNAEFARQNKIKIGNSIKVI